MIQRILLAACAMYLIVFLAAAYYTRPRRRRIIGALAGGVATGVSLPLLLGVATARGWWRCTFLAVPGAPLLTFLICSVSYAAMALVGWRIDRRFGWRGIVWSLVLVSVLGPPHDYAVASRYPELMQFGPGLAPIAATSPPTSSPTGWL